PFCKALPETPNVTSQLAFAFTLLLEGVKDTPCTSAAADALTPEAENMPKANIVAIAAMAMSSASPKVVPILVFIYSYLLVLRT
ncbi:MAG: hypothetical protein J4N85_01990, partial [Chloroflexi bacterium]|nr:hypothetical protein [Chloroflexota bacterium]